MTFSCRGFLFGPLRREGGISGLFLILALLGFLPSSMPATAQDSRGIIVAAERTALVIGNNAYQAAPLKNPVNDAEDMSRVLTSLGFRVTLLKNVDRRSMEDSIRSFGRQLKHGGVGLFYFAGHGMQVEGRNYLIPVNARIESESDIKYEAVDAGFVLGKMEDAANQLNIVVLDACRSNPFSRNFRNREQGLARLDAPTGSLIVYATAPGEVAADGLERNGIFTKHLLRHMQTPNLPVEHVLKRVRIDVASETKHRQIPWESSSLMGDFYFKTEKAVPDSQPTVIATPKASPDIPSSTSNENEKVVLEKQPARPQLASLPPNISDKPDTAGKTSLAIFPIYFSASQAMGTMYAQAYSDTKKAAVAALKEVLVHHQDFFPIYSYYELNNKLAYKKIEPATLSREVENNLWDGGAEKPNIKLIVQIGKKLAVDAVFVCKCDLASIDVYLIEVNKGDIFYKSYQYSYMNGYSNVPTHMKNFFANYKGFKVN
jgi:hypothetical protein